MLTLFALLFSAPALADVAVTTTERIVNVFDTPESQMVTKLTPEIVKDNPMAVLFMKSPPWDDLGQVLTLMQHNAALYDYMPPKLRANPNVQALAEKLGLPMGVRFTADTQARTQPAMDAPVSKGASDTTNGYLVDVRPVQSFASGDQVRVLETTTANGVQWHKVTQARQTSREQDQKSFRTLSNVGGVTFADFSHGVDEGWVPAAITEPVILSARYVTGLYRFDSVENGDLGVYVNFDEMGFDGFDTPHYTMMSLFDAGKIRKGDRIRVVWKESLQKSHEPTLEWLPFTPWEPSEN
jgi:hypothetical protein